MRISRGSVYRRIDSGDIESVRVGNSIRVPESLFVAYMEDIGLAWMVKEAGLTSTPRPLADPALHRNKLTGDVHLLLFNRDGQVLFGRRRNMGFEDGAYHLTGVRAGSLAVAC